MVSGLLFLLLIGVAVTSVFFFFQARKMEQRQLPGGGPPGFANQPNRLLTDGSGERNAMNMQIKDIVSHYGDDYIVEGRLDYWEDGDTWVNYMLVDGDRTIWLNAEDDDRLEVSLWEDVGDLHVTETPPPRELQYMGRTFYMKGAGTARVARQGRTGSKNAVSVDYFDYRSDGPDMLSIENWNGDIEISRGTPIDPVDLDILPGDLSDY